MVNCKLDLHAEFLGTFLDRIKYVDEDLFQGDLIPCVLVWVGAVADLSEDVNRLLDPGHCYPGKAVLLLGYGLWHRCSPS